MYCLCIVCVQYLLNKVSFIGQVTRRFRSEVGVKSSAAAYNSRGLRGRQKAMGLPASLLPLYVVLDLEASIQQ